MVTLTTSDPGIVAVPSEGTVTVPAGQVSQTLAAAGVGPGQATISATLNGSTVQS